MDVEKEAMKKEMNNLSFVRKFSESEILGIIKDRYGAGEIYTFAGPALVSVNPHRPVALYGLPNKKRAERDNEYPHVFTIGERAHKGMTQNKDQVIVLSGESGSGKSVNANYILEYLSERTGEKNIGKRLLYASPILELFGNARTENNANSSRFGKYVEIYYRNREIAGAHIKAFLLEKGRAQSSQDNFHAVDLLKDLLRDKTEYAQKQAEVRVRTVLSNFQKVGIEKKEILEVFKTLALVVNLVEIEIEIEKTGEIGEIDKKRDKEEITLTQRKTVQKVAKMLGVEEETVSSLILESKLTVGKDVLVKKKTKAEAEATKHTLIRVIYEKVFETVVFLINRTLLLKKEIDKDIDEYLDEKEGIKRFIEEISGKEDLISLPAPEPTRIDKSKKYVKIGVLDIYGFEIMEENGFDQLCINYANEKIQAEYVRRIIEENRKAFREEGIELENMEVLSQAESVFEGSLGIVSLLDEESFMPGGTVENWLTKVSSTGIVKTRGHTMEIEHYAGKVQYSADEFVRKNKNTYSEICTLLNQTGVHGLKQPEEHRGRMSQTGVIGEFQKSLQSLLSEINKSVLHYIRCIKPGRTNGFTDEYVKKQLRLTGIFETIKIFMLGFYVKTTKDEFTERYIADPNDVSGAQVGTKYVFLTEDVFNRLEHARRTREAEAASVITNYLYGKYLYQKRSQEKEAQVQKEEEKKAYDQDMAEGCRITDKKDCIKNMIKKDQNICEKDSITDFTDRKTREFTNALGITVLSEDEIEHTEDALSGYLCIRREPSVTQQLVEELSPGSDDRVNTELLESFSIESKEKGCKNCYKIEEKYDAQISYLSECQNQIDSLKIDLESAKDLIDEKNMLIRDLSHKIEVMLYELSSGEYFKATTNPQQNTKSHFLKDLSNPAEKKTDLIFRKICKLFMQNIPPAYLSYYHSVSCAFALFRVSAMCPGGISENIGIAVKEFLSSAYAILVVKKSSIPLYTGFFLSNGIFIGRTSPSAQTSEMVQSVFAEGCKAITEEIVNFGFDFLFKSPPAETINLLSRLLKKPSLDSVISHLKMVDSVLSSLCVPRPVIVAIFEYIAKTVDALGFEYITKKEKKITAKNLTYLCNSLDTLSALLIDVKVSDPYRCFPYLKRFIDLATAQKNSLGSNSVFVQVGLFTSSQLMACISCLSTEIRGACSEKLESALKHTPRPERVPLPSPVFTMPINTLPDDPNELYKALSNCPEKDALCTILEEFNLPFSWLK